MPPRADHRIPALAGHVVTAAEQFMDRTYFEGKVMKTALADAWIKQEQVVMIVGRGTPKEITPSRIGIGQFETEAVSIEFLMVFQIIRHVDDMGDLER